VWTLHTLQHRLYDRELESQTHCMLARLRASKGPSSHPSARNHSGGVPFNHWKRVCHGDQAGRDPLVSVAKKCNGTFLLRKFTVWSRESNRWHSRVRVAQQQNDEPLSTPVLMSTFMNRLPRLGNSFIIMSKIGTYLVTKSRPPIGAKWTATSDRCERVRPSSRPLDEWRGILRSLG
jgi:hypothetical protein